MELRNEWQDGVHVLHSVVEIGEGAPLADDFVLRYARVALNFLHILDQLSELLCVDLVPEGLLPRVELQVDQSNQVPHFLQRLELVLTVFKLLVAGALEVEQSFQVVELFSLIFKLACLLMEITEHLVRVVDHVNVALGNTIGESVLELDSELLNDNAEAGQSSLDRLCLLVL